MRKFVLLTLFMAFGLFTIAQQNFEKLKYPRAHESVSVKIDLDRELIDPRITPTESDFSMPSNFAQAAVYKRNDNLEEAIIIETTYDLQSNSNLCSRVIAWPDGSVAATVTMGWLPISANRGTGYNYYDGASWGPPPSERIESVYAGWPSITHYGENGEAMVSHNLIDGLWNVVMHVREEKGSGDWVQKHVFPNPEGQEMTWPKLVSSGENNQYLHLIAGDQSGPNLETYLFYNRSTDGGETWEGWTNVPEVNDEDYDFRITPDDIVFASQGDNVAFGIATHPAWDVFYVKSEDNGETWQKTNIFENPLFQYWDDFENATFDTTYVPDGSLAIAMDLNGDVHSVFGITRRGKPELGEFWNTYPFVSGIVYWTESMGAFPEHPNGELYTLEPEFLYENGMLVGWTPDLDGDGEVNFSQFPNASDVFTYRTPGMSTMPSIAIDDQGSIAIFFSTVDELRWNETFYYRSVFATYKDGIYGTWYYIEDHLMENFIHFLSEGVFPTTTAKAFNNTFHVIYQTDNLQGVWAGGGDNSDHDPSDNIIWAVKIGGYWVGNYEFTNPITNISSAYPNPVIGTQFNVDINLSRTSKNAQVTVHNIAGQMVYQQNLGTLSIGMNRVQVDVTGYQSGIYFYTVTVDDYKETKKVIVR